ncbi:HD domain-containing phosphohydrolase [Fusobacterium varium]
MKKLIIIFFVIITSFIFAKEPLTIKIPLNLTDMYLYKNLETGKYEGVYAELFEKINNEKFNSNYILNYKLESENPEIMIRVVDSYEDEHYNYIPTSITYKVSVLVKNNNNIRKISDLNGLKIAYIPNSRGLKEFEERFSNIGFKKVTVSNEDKGLEALEIGEADAFIIVDWSESNSVESHIRIIESLQYKEQIAVREDKTELYNSIKNYIASLSASNFTNIIKGNRINYYTYLLKDTPNQEIVRNKFKEVKVRLPEAKYALPLYYEKSGKYKGLLPDILKDLESIIGIPFKLTKADGDINAYIIKNQKKMEKYIFSSPYYSNDIAIANRKLDSYGASITDLDNKKILVVQNSYFSEYLPQVAKDIKIIPVKSVQEGLKKLSAGEGDYFVGFSSVIRGAITNEFLDDKVKIAGTINENMAISLGVKSSEEELSQLVNTIMRSFAVDKTLSDPEANKNILVEKNYKLMMKVAIPTIIFIIILIIVLIKSEKNRKKAEILGNALVETLEMINQLDQEEAGDHAKRLSMYSELLAEKSGLDKKVVSEIKKFAILHDLGKVIVPNEILNKPGKLTAEEFNKVKEHAIVGHRLAEKLGLGSVAENLVKFHHEKWNGLGYPLGLKGTEIPIEGRIVALADTYDTLRQDKAYRPGFSHEKAVQIITEESNISFDPELVNLFLKNSELFKKIYEENTKSIYLADEIYSAIKNK